MKKFFIISIFFISSLISYALNFSIYPTRFEVDMKKSNTQELYITNNTSSPLRIEIFPESDKEFGKDYNLNSNITIFPKVISIKPAGKQTVRFRVKPSENIKNGELKSFITFREITNEIKTKNTENKNNSISSEVKLITEISIPVYAYGDNLNIKGGVKNLSFNYDKNILSVNGTSFSKGNTSLKFNYKILNSSGKILSEGRFGNSARNGEKNLSIGIPFEENLKGKKVTFIIFDQNENICYKKSIVL